MPLTELWDDCGIVPATHARDLTAQDIASLIRNGSVQFVIAVIGEKPHWIPPGQTIAFWKSEVKGRLIGKFINNDQLLPGGGYWAQEWRRADNDTAIVVLTLVS